MFFAGWLTPPVYSLLEVSNVLRRFVNSSSSSLFMIIISAVWQDLGRLVNSSSSAFFPFFFTSSLSVLGRLPKSSRAFFILLQFHMFFEGWLILRQCIL